MLTAFMVFGVMAACSSPEERATTQIDTNTTASADTSGTDTITNTGSLSGSNGTGTDTTDTRRQEATRQESNQ